MPYTLLGIKIDCINRVFAKTEIEKRLEAGTKTAMFTPNLLMLGKSQQRRKKNNILNCADLNIADGSGVYLALRARKAKNAERIAGIDIAHFALDISAQRGLRVYLLGGKSGVAERAADKLTKEIDGLCICGTHHGYFDTTPNSDEFKKVTEDIKNCRADVLAVCLGYPKQEQFIIDAYNSLGNVRLFMALGGSLDVWSGDVRRAPACAQKLHLEWLWRCINQPRRLIDAFSLPVYFIRTMFFS